jgi:hypothetical protein
MKAASLDKPFKLTPDFLAAFVVLAVPTLWLSQPWSWDLPIVSKIAGIAFLPFAAAIVCYCPVLFAMALFRGGKEERKSASAFVGAIAGTAVFLGAVWIIYGFDRLPSFVATPAVLIASWIYSRSKPNRPNLPTPVSVTPAAGAPVAPDTGAAEL